MAYAESHSLLRSTAKRNDAVLCGNRNDALNLSHPSHSLSLLTLLNETELGSSGFQPFLMTFCDFSTDDPF
jgi:hypothetical protein